MQNSKIANEPYEQLLRIDRELAFYCMVDRKLIFENVACESLYDLYVTEIVFLQCVVHKTEVICLQCVMKDLKNGTITGFKFRTMSTEILD